MLSILELVSRHIRNEHPTINRISFRMDNAANYHNIILPVVALFIMAKYGIELVSIVHNEMQDGKGPADLHFAFVTYFVDKYIETLNLDVVTPLDLFNAINHGKVLEGTFAKLFDVSMENAGHVTMENGTV